MTECDVIVLKQTKKIKKYISSLLLFLVHTKFVLLKKYTHIYIYIHRCIYMWVMILWKEKSRALESYRLPTFKLAGGAERRCAARYAVPPESGGGRQGSLPSSYIMAAWCNFGSESWSVLLHTTKLCWHNSSTRSRVCRPVSAWLAGAPGSGSAESSCHTSRKPGNP